MCMKKVFFTALVAGLGLAGSAQAQFSAGTVSVGGSFSLSVENTERKSGSTTREDDPVTTFELSPSIGYFMADDLELGVQIGYTRIGQSGDNYSRATNMLAVGPYVRKYFSFGETVALFGEAGFTIASGKTTREQGNQSNDFGKYSVFRVGIAPGIVFRPAERLGIELSAGFLGYTSVTQDDSDWDGNYTRKSSDFGLSLDTRTTSLGLKFYF